MVADSLQYLTALGNEVHNDKDLALEIGLAYVKVAHAQGDPTSPNLGQFVEAEKNLQNAEKFVEPILSKYPNDKVALGTAATIAHDRMVLANAQGRSDEVLPDAAKAAEHLARQPPEPLAGVGEQLVARGLVAELEPVDPRLEARCLVGGRGHAGSSSGQRNGERYLPLSRQYRHHSLYRSGSENHKKILQNR